MVGMVGIENIMMEVSDVGGQQVCVVSKCLAKLKFC